MSILVFGHKNPDTDTICSAIAYSELKNRLGVKSKPVRLGQINEETKFVLNYFNVEVPEMIETVEGEKVILVDHNERTQTADGFEQARVLELIDHHRISNFNVDEPLLVRMKPVGCTATIILDLYRENNLLPEKKAAGLMLSAIISDTLLFKSPTCTREDVKAAHELADIAGINFKEYGMEMLKAGTNLDGKDELELLNMDMKIFEVDGIKMGIGQVNTVNEADMLKRKIKFLDEMKNLISQQKLNFFMFVITNILTNDSTAIVAGNGNDIIEKAFNTKVENNEVLLKGVVSRKKQIIPPLTKAIQN